MIQTSKKVSHLRKGNRDEIQTSKKASDLRKETGKKKRVSANKNDIRTGKRRKIACDFERSPLLISIQLQIL